MKHILLTLFMITMCISLESQEEYPPVIVLELFTSQGCSSCPPADELLTQTQEANTEVIALSYHVDYWNYIGWTDPFSQKVFSNKQRRYSQKFNNSTIYTPQTIINGKEHFVGSNAKIMNSKLNDYLKISAENKIEIGSTIRSDDKISFDYNIFGNVKRKSMRIALVIDERITEISRRENRNRVLKNSNIVVSEAVVNLKTNTGKYDIDIPKSIHKDDSLKIIIIIQKSDLDIVGATNINL